MYYVGAQGVDERAINVHCYCYYYYYYSHPSLTRLFPSLAPENPGCVFPAYGGWG